MIKSTKTFNWISYLFFLNMKLSAIKRPNGPFIWWEQGPWEVGHRGPRLLRLVIDPKHKAIFFSIFSYIYIKKYIYTIFKFRHWIQYEGIWKKKKRKKKEKGTWFCLTYLFLIDKNRGRGGADQILMEKWPMSYEKDGEDKAKLPLNLWWYS